MRVSGIGYDGKGTEQHGGVRGKMSDQTGQQDDDILDAQRAHWECNFVAKSSMFGDAPSVAAEAALEVFKREGVRKLLELGAGQGRDTVLFAQKDLKVTALEYCSAAIEAIAGKAESQGLPISLAQHDVRLPLPFGDESFDACYSHMLACMAITGLELGSLFQEIRRVLRPGGLNIYTVRHTGDPHYGTGIHRGEDIYETEGGFIVHFFTRQKVDELAEGYSVVSVDEFEESDLPKRLFRVVLRKE